MKKIKFHGIIIVCAAFFLLIESLTWAGHEIGNGGGTWVCTSPNKIDLPDTLEALKFGLDLDSTMSASMRLQRAGRRLKEAAPEIARYTGVDGENPLWPFPEYLLQPMNNVILLSTQDSGRLQDVPLGYCKPEFLNFVQLANYTHDGHIILQESLWNHMNEFNQTALKTHELVYRALRKKLSVKDSEAARTITAALLSSLVIDQLRAVIQKALADTLERVHAENALFTSLLSQQIKDCEHAAANFEIVPALNEKLSELLNDSDRHSLYDLTAGRICKLSASGSELKGSKREAFLQLLSSEVQAALVLLRF